MKYKDTDKIIEEITTLQTEWEGTFTVDGIRMAKEIVENAPEADVVPKSEAERWRRNLEAVLEEIPETKKEVAREIFEEIEKTFIDSAALPNCARFVDIDKIAELKKKYTEEKE